MITRRQCPSRHSNYTVRFPKIVSEVLTALSFYFIHNCIVPNRILTLSNVSMLPLIVAQRGDENLTHQGSKLFIIHLSSSTVRLSVGVSNPSSRSTCSKLLAITFRRIRTYILTLLVFVFFSDLILIYPISCFRVEVTARWLLL